MHRCHFFGRARGCCALPRALGLTLHGRYSHAAPSMNTSLTSQFFSSLASSLGWRFTVAISAIAIVSPAFAGAPDKVVAPEPVVEVLDWTGFYAGGSLGIAMGDYDFGGYRARVFPEGSFSNADTIIGDGVLGGNGGHGHEFDFDEVFSPFNFAVHRHQDDAQVGFMGGGQIGYNLQWRQWVFGIEADIHATDMDAESKFNERRFVTDTIEFGEALTETFQVDADVSLKSVRRATTDLLASARLRVGRTFGRLLIYGTGGAAFADINISGRDRSRVIYTVTEFDNIIQPPPIIGEGGSTQGSVISDVTTVGPFSNRFIGDPDDGDFEIGWTAGLGGEVLINRWLSVGVEYRHSDFGDFDYNLSSSGGLNFRSGDDTDIDFSVDQVVLKVNILFSGLFGK